MKILVYLEKQSRSYLTVLGLILVVLVGIVDYVTGTELAVSIFYVIPVSLAARAIDRKMGILISIASAAAGLAADLLAGGFSAPAVSYWNAIMRLGLYLIVTYTLSALRSSEERREELSQFVVHDLRSPLSVVIMGLQSLQDSAAASMEATEADLIQMCQISCNRMLTLINSLLDLARLESGQMPLQLDVVSVKELVEGSLQQVSIWAKRNHITLKSELDANLEAVYADSAVTMRILVNLLSNAIKFSQPESAVTIRARPSDNGLGIFSVADQGRGIPQEWADKVFDKFAQVEAHRAGGVLGSGLGLTFCRQAIGVQGGRIWLESETGKGTTITFTLPTSAR